MVVGARSHARTRGGSLIHASDFDTLIRHHTWAYERLLDTAALVRPERLATGSLSQGTLFTTMRYVADVSQSWGEPPEASPTTARRNWNASWLISPPSAPSGWRRMPS